MKVKKTTYLMTNVLAVLSFTFSLSAIGQPSGPEKYKCETACGSATPTAYCLVAPRDSKLAFAFGEVRKKFLAPSTPPLLSSELKHWFALTDDPCKRSDTVYSGGLWTNDGEACVLSAKLDILPGAKSVVVSISMPSRFQFTAKGVGDTVTFTTVNSSPFLRIEDPNLQLDWGGVIKGATANTSSALFQLPRGCIKLPL